MARNEDGVEPNKKGTKRKSEALDEMEKKPENVEKKPKVKKPVVSTGATTNLNRRKLMLLNKLSDLITNKKLPSQVTDNHSDVLESEISANGLFMERIADSVFIWASNCSKGIKIKFQLLADFDVESEDLNVKKPLVAFSHGFNMDDSWKLVKETITEVFAYNGKNVGADADYLYSFTKIGGKIALRVYKIHTSPNLEAATMKLQQMGPTIIVRPVEIIRPDGKIFFQGSDKFKRADSSLDFSSSAIYIDKARPEAVPHLVEQLSIDILLPMLPDLSEWNGYTTTVAEYFQCYHAFKQKVVPGTGPAPHASVTSTPVQNLYHLLLPFKHFARSLMVELTDVIEKREYCFKKLSAKHLRFKGKKLAILGAERIPYTEVSAEKNLEQAGIIIRRQLWKQGLRNEHLPKDLKSVLKLLNNNAMANSILVRNSVVWMDCPARCHTMDDLFGDFMFSLTGSEQLVAAADFPISSDWIQKVQQNWLLDDVRRFSLPKNKTGAALKQWHRNNASKLVPEVNNSKKAAKRLYFAQQCFKTLRNPFHHLRQSAEKLKYRNLSKKDIDLIVSSCFEKVYVKAQKDIPLVFSKRKKVNRELSSYKRFETYFQGSEAIEFEADDIK